jgi:lysyl-tRNA synthetase class 1
MNELDGLEDVYFGKKQVNDKRELGKLRGLYLHCWVMKPPSKASIHVPYNMLTFLTRMAPEDNSVEFIEEKLRSYGYLPKGQHADDGLRKRIEYASNWSQDFSEIKETPVSLKPEEKDALTTLVKVLETEDDPDKIQNAIFNSAKSCGIQPGAFFRLLYTILMGAQQGPRLGPYVLAMGKRNVVSALQRVIGGS